MPTLTVTKTYDDTQVLSEADLDNIKNSLETFFNTTKIDSDNIQTGGITAACLASNSVSEAKIATGAVTTAKIGDDAVTTAKILDANVTQAKRAALGQQVSSASGAYSGTTDAPTFTDVTNLSVTITTTGRPVFVGLQPDGTNEAYIGTGGTSDGGEAEFKILRGATTIYYCSFQLVAENSSGSSSAGMNLPPGAIWVIDTGASAGSNTYKLQVADGFSSGSTYFVANCKLVAYEL